ncbi:MAG TPA: pilus assembly protein TadG-related protein [Thermoanaerobaculia bacterium]|nr:pilus assembly protein TadG-related protein [Thermoanaerobaculia bacterium]
MTTNGNRRRSRGGERGQVLVLFLLVLITMILIGTVAVVLGQTLVRRQQAQMVVDAAAFAGAARQAEGLNTIAHWNKRSLDFQQAIHISLLLPYVDMASTTMSRQTPPPLWDDWAGNAIKKYQNIFTLMNEIIDGANLYYSKANALTGPNGAASKVVDANFGGSASGDRMFRGEAPAWKGMLFNGPSDMAKAHKLVNLTSPKKYAVQGYSYAPAPELAGYLATCAPPTFNLNACWILAMYGIANTWYMNKGWIDPIEFKFGRFYENNQPEVRFSYFIRVKNTPAVFGKTFFTDVPEILVVASAKPYGGYLGDKFKTGFLNYWTYEGNKEISPTYKAKLVPVSTAEKINLAIANLKNPASAKWLGITH